jgi:glutaconate CoA-transferase subunit A
MAVPDLNGTGFVDEDWTGGRTASVTSPFGAATVISAERPDVAFIHADLADEDGNAVIRGPLGDVVLAAQAATSVVVVAEQIAAPARLRGAGITIPGMLVDAVVEMPGAVLPDGAIGRYGRDVEAYRRYSENSSTAAGFERWLNTHLLAGAR